MSYMTRNLRKGLSYQQKPDCTQLIAFQGHSYTPYKQPVSSPNARLDLYDSRPIQTGAVNVLS